MQERLQKIISAAGIASRRAAEKLINEGRVSVNGVIAVLGQTADLEFDTVTVDGEPVTISDKRTYIMLNKPQGYVTTLSDEKGRKDVSMLVKDVGVRLYPVGRLDMDSEGLLLFTNDGDFANKLMHPSHEVNKTYRVTVEGFSQEGLQLLRQPIILDGYRIKPPEVTVCDDGKTLLITIHEGRNRQVRRMCAAAGMKVKRLIRVSEGNLKLDNLKVGEWRYLTAQEVAALLK